MVLSPDEEQVILGCQRLGPKQDPSVAGVPPAIGQFMTLRKILGGELQVWDRALKEPRKKVAAYSSAINILAITPDKRSLVASSNDGSIGVWDLNGYKEVRRLHGKGKIPNCLAFSRDGGRMAVCLGDKAIYFWDVRGF